MKRSANVPSTSHEFRKALLRKAIELMLSGDEKTGRAILRNYINATVGFRQLEAATCGCLAEWRPFCQMASSLIFRRRKA